MQGDVARDQRRAAFLGNEGGDLHVECADFGALFVVQHRGADRAGDMVFRVFRRRTHVDDFVEGGQL